MSCSIHSFSLPFRPSICLTFPYSYSLFLFLHFIYFPFCLYAHSFRNFIICCPPFFYLLRVSFISHSPSRLLLALSLFSFFFLSNFALLMISSLFTFLSVITPAAATPFNHSIFLISCYKCVYAGPFFILNFLLYFFLVFTCFVILSLVLLSLLPHSTLSFVSHFHTFIVFSFVSFAVIQSLSSSGN